ncbi:MAG: hypothetical protein JWL86_1304, partial [Rhizobium sp.]|nr:hypothetical protein [Rhizobium sp.]
YRELDHHSEVLADELRAASIGPGSIVGLCLPRSLDLIVALLAILKSGAAYLPLDPVYPADRLSYMVEDSDVAMVIGLQKSLGWLPGNRHRLDLDCLAADLRGEKATPLHRTPKAAPASSDLAYVIYTSGSTGNPKGVGIEHSSVVRLFTSTEHWFAFQSTDVWTMFHSVSFDFTVWEIWGALLYGGRLVIVPENVTRDPAAFLCLLRDEGVTVLNQTPSAFSALEQADSDRKGQDHLSLRLIIFGGEALDPRRLVGWFERRGERANLVNMYGITETTVHVTYRPLKPGDATINGSPIGVPIPDLEILLLDSETMSPVPEGKIGEIFVGGPGLARGYLNRPDLTAARFIPHPWRNGERLYRTGDLARLAPNGEYFHLGRTDHQVKIRGFRVELGEIEAALRSHEDVLEAAAMMRSDDTGQARLVGYVVQNPFAPQRPELLRSHVASILPEHMVPALFVFIASLPLTVNGKLDRDALPLPGRARPISAESYRLPGNALERRICGVIAEVLRTDVVGIDDNFFDLGANSLLIVEIHRRLSTEAKMNLKLMDLYRYPNVRALEQYLNSSHTPITLGGAKARGARSRMQMARTTRKPRSDGCPT